MPEVHSYDPRKVTITIGGRVITGFAADGLVTISNSVDAVTPVVGCLGDVTYVENADNSAVAALTLMSTSSSIGYLRELASRRRAVRFAISDVNETDPVQVSCDNCRVTKMPDLNRTSSTQTITINVFLPDVQYK